MIFSMNVSYLLALAVFISCIGSSNVRGVRMRFKTARSYRSSRSYSYHFSSYVSVFTDSRISSPTSVRKALLAGTVYGATIWRLRRPDYYHDDDALPTICYNDKYNHSDSGNVSYYGRFVCPMEFQGFDYNYCCGKEGHQYCCTFWDDYRRVSAMVFIIILVVGGVAFFTSCLVKSLRAKSCLASRLREKMDVPCKDFKSNKNKEKPPIPASGNENIRFYGFDKQSKEATAKPKPYISRCAGTYPENGYSYPF